MLVDIENGECPEVEDLIRDKIDMELELAKNLMQQEFDETLESERVRGHVFYYHQCDTWHQEHSVHINL